MALPLPPLWTHLHLLLLLFLVIQEVSFFLIYLYFFVGVDIFCCTFTQLLHRAKIIPQWNCLVDSVASTLGRFAFSRTSFLEVWSCYLILKIYHRWLWRNRSSFCTFLQHRTHASALNDKMSPWQRFCRPRTSGSSRSNSIPRATNKILHLERRRMDSARRNRIQTNASGSCSGSDTKNIKPTTLYETRLDLYFQSQET